MATSPSSCSSPAMSFHEMSLLNMQFELEDVRERIVQLRKNKEMIDSELSRKIKIEKELDAKAKRYRKILREKYKTGNYSPSKYGLEPGTPLKMTPDKTTFTLSSPMSQPYIWGPLQSSCTSTVGLGQMQSNVTPPPPEPILFREHPSVAVKVTPSTPTSTAASVELTVLSPCQSIAAKVVPVAQTSTVPCTSGQLKPLADVWDDDDALLLSAEKVNSQNELLVNPSSHNTEASNETKNNDKTNAIAIHPLNTNKSDVPLTFAEALEHVSGPLPHSTGGTEVNQIAEATGINQSDPTCTDGTTIFGPSPHSTGGTEANEKSEATGINQIDPTCTDGTTMSGPSPHSTGGTEANEKAEATGINQSDPTCTGGTNMTEPSINSGAGTNNNLGKNKLDKLNISESVRGIKNKKKEGSNCNIKNQKPGQCHIGVKDDCIPFDVCRQLFVSGK